MISTLSGQAAAKLARYVCGGTPTSRRKCGRRATPSVGDVNLTLSAADMATAAQILDASVVVPAHVDSWEHFTEGLDDVREALEAAGLREPLHVPAAPRV
ncbi:hypothetical protein [Paractinoplanes lichenicola]|uniref:Zn-dependent hydrolase n=1 Tax=Paractinoplanes lichenicola TaxID=2802976 RepID=A0ABS1VQ13_9ACTN|nr:hypothetical protein [Actinoplanes lichenicola]MBL7256714.1 hypothetical protein [Actinoplanes lichenicola]